MNTFRAANSKMWNVVEVTAVPAQGDATQHSEIVNPWPLTWKEARMVLEGRLLDSCHRGGARVIDVKLLVAGPRRPWTVETLQAFIDHTGGASEVGLSQTCVLHAMLSAKDAPPVLDDLTLLTQINQAALQAYL